MCALYRENSHHFTSPSDHAFSWHYIFLTVEPLYPYPLAQLGLSANVYGYRGSTVCVWNYVLFWSKVNTVACINLPSSNWASHCILPLAYHLFLTGFSEIIELACFDCLHIALRASINRFCWDNELTAQCAPFLSCYKSAVGRSLSLSLSLSLSHSSSLSSST